ncbi:amidohydrolase family protein [Acidobacteriota bacterium]
MNRKNIWTVFLFLVPCLLFSQDVKFSSLTRQFIVSQSPLIVLQNARVIDGTGAPAKTGLTILIRDGKIANISDSEDIQIPEEAEVIDLEGKSLLPGFIMLHEHMFYPAGNGHYNHQYVSFPKLYLAGGVTTLRTTGTLEPFGDLNLKEAIDSGRTPGPKMDVTSPYFNGPGLGLLQIKTLKAAEDARKMVNYWDNEGVDSYKVYAQITREELQAVVEEAHKRGKKVTGHLGSVTYREAADLGIDNLEHGFFVSSDFVQDKKPDINPGSGAQRQSLLALDIDGPEAQSLIDHLIKTGVALTSTLPVYETYVPGRPSASSAALDALLPETRDLYLRNWARIAHNSNSDWPELIKKGMALEKKFFDAGGLLLVGTDPTGYGGVIAGYSNFRAIELLVEAGLSHLEAIQVATLNGARYLDQEDTIGTIEVGKIADLLIIDGNPDQNISDVRKIEIVIKDGIGYDSQKLFDSVKGQVGLR